MRALKLPLVSNYADSRGNIRKFFESNAPFGVSQILNSFTKTAFTFRGLHCQLGDDSEEKIIICNSGEVVWVSVDFSTFKHDQILHESYLEIGVGEAIRIPPNCLNGMLSKTDNVLLTILASRPYNPNSGVNVSPFGDYFLNEFSQTNNLRSSQRIVPSLEISQSEFINLI